MSEVQLNKIQIRAEILTVLSKLQSTTGQDNIDSFLSVLDAQEDKVTILDVLIKELSKANEQKAVLICFLLFRLCEKAPLEEKLWEILKNRTVSDSTKSFVMHLLKDLGNKIDYDKFSVYFNNPDDVVDADTKKLLHVAIVNPEAQIDFLDFLKSLSDADKKMLVGSLGEDYTSDALANILIPLFLFDPESNLGKLSVDILGTTKSQLALHSLTEGLEFVKDTETIALIKKNISALKLAGVREDNTIEFYKEILSASKPYKSYISFPDGAGNQAVIFSRIRENSTVQIFAVVVNEKWGVVDCFGFNEIGVSEFERIVDRFYNGDVHIEFSEEILKSMLKKFENITRNSGGELSYEYICWRSLLMDIQDTDFDLERILASNYNKKELSEEEFEDIYEFDFVQRWFLNTETSPEFSDLISQLNSCFLENNFDVDFNKIIAENVNVIFDKSDKNLLKNRILLSAYLMDISGFSGEAGLLYSLAFDSKMFDELIQRIFKKSIYEYYVAEKFKYKDNNVMKNIFTRKIDSQVKKMSQKQLEVIIAIIEGLWVDE